jgi:putative oxidoreductase
MRIAAVVLRTLMGLLFLFASVTYFGGFITPPPLEGAMKTFNEGIEASVYLLPLAKSVELLCGLAFVTGRFVPLAAILIAPIIVNIVLIQAFLDPAQLPTGIFLVIANATVAWRHREVYAPLFRARA